MAMNRLKPVDVNDVVGVPELGLLILGFLDDLDDIRSARLTSKRFHRVAQVRFWRAIRLPYLLPEYHSTDQRAFWDRYASPLGRFTLSLSVDLQVASIYLYNAIRGMRWEYKGSYHVAKTIKQQTDIFFDGLEATLSQTRRLRAFSGRDVPRIFDLVLLVTKHCSEIASLDITASSRDTFGLRVAPAQDLASWKSDLQANPGFVVPLANAINFDASKINPTRPFQIPNLRSLSLNNLQYSYDRPSLYVGPLVTLLKGSPGLTYLELSLRHQVGSVAEDWQFRQQFPSNLPQGHFMEALCLRYGEVGGRPLGLKVLRLGYGCQIVDQVPSLNTPHYLCSLLDPARLEELHVESPTFKDGNFLRVDTWRFGLTLLSSLRFPADRCLTSVRKITMPWANGTILWSLQESVQEHLKNVIVRIDQPSPGDWKADNAGYPTWIPPRRPSPYRPYRTLTLKGLVLPSELMCPKDADEFFTFVPWITTMESLKIRMPALTARDAWDDGRNYRRCFYRHLAQMRDLRELWLADGRGTWRQQDGQPGQFVPERYPTDTEFRRYSTIIAEKCPKLEYLRILDRAWRITRAAAGGGQPELRQFTAWEVKNDIPEAFDFGKPKII